jgi:hypothetical protein
VARFIAAQRVEYQIPHATACRALGVCEAWFYKWRDGDASPRRARRERLTVEIKRIFALHHGKYGSPRITDDLREAGWTVSEKTVAAIMREQHLMARPKRRRKHTTRLSVIVVAIGAMLIVVPTGSLNHPVRRLVAWSRLAAGRHEQDRPVWLDRSVASPPLRFAHRPVPSPFPRAKGRHDHDHAGHRRAQT